ncbi:MAG: hypothetical protein WCH74_06750, partial [Chloroflexota bacterium]
MVGRVGQTHEQCVAAPSTFLAEPSFCDISGESNRSEDVSRVVDNGRLERLVPNEGALFEYLLFNRLVLECRHDCPVVSAVGVSEISRPDIQTGLARQLVGIGGVARFGERLIDGEESPLRVLEPHKEGEAIDERSQVLRAFAESRLGCPEFGDFACDAENADQLVVVVEHRRLDGLNQGA